MNRAELGAVGYDDNAAGTIPGNTQNTAPFPENLSLRVLCLRVGVAEGQRLTSPVRGSCGVPFTSARCCT